MGLFSKAYVELNLHTALKEVHKRNGSFSALVFEGDPPSGGSFISRILPLVSGFALAAELSESRCVIFGKASLDGELLAHRLSSSVQGKQVVAFKADDPQNALSLLRTCLD